MINLFDLIFHRQKYNNDRFIARLRRHGVTVGAGCLFRYPSHTSIDLTRPALVTIGDNVDFNDNFTIFTHDYVTKVFLHTHQQFINSSGAVHIGNNIYFGRDVTVLKGVTIGDNCVIGLGSVVCRDIPAGSVATGYPARVVDTIDNYYKRRLEASTAEAFEYARSIVKNLKRRPVMSDFHEEFHLFINGCDADRATDIPIKKQLSGVFNQTPRNYEIYRQNHKAPYANFEEFLKAAGID